MRELLKHRRAFETWVGLGDTRSFRKLARNSEYTASTLHRWCNIFKWEERLTQGITQVAIQEPTRPTASKLTTNVETLIKRVDTVLSQCFVLDPDTGKYGCSFVVKTASDFAKLVATQKDLLFIHKDLTELPAATAKSSKLAENLNIFMGDMTNEQKLQFLKITPTDAEGAGRDPGSIQDADFTEVSDRAHTEED